MATIAGKNENMINVHRMSEIDWAETVHKSSLNNL